MAVLFLFVLILIGCVALNISILWALAAGYVLFALYSLKKGFSLKEVIKMSAEGIKKVKNILITFILIGVLTALWRAGGTISAIVCYSVRVMRADLFVLIAFLLNCLVSFLTGTAFGTAATMGAVCMTMSAAMQLNPVMVGGAVLAGSYFGDRCSPVSTSALLVSELTDTDIYDNIKNMFKTAAIPFILSCVIYIFCGMSSSENAGAAADINALFSKEFNMNIAVFIPAVLILALSLAKVNVKIAMSASIISSIAVCLLCQGTSFLEILKFSLLGYTAKHEELSGMINGGGIVSMIKVTAIVCISSSYSGIFQKTGMLDKIQEKIEGAKLPAFGTILITAVASSAVACNQTLSIMLTHQLCKGLESDKSKLAIYLENSAVIVAPLIPWSIAAAVVQSSSGAPALSIVTAFFLFLVPLWNLALSLIKSAKKQKSFEL